MKVEVLNLLHLKMLEAQGVMGAADILIRSGYLDALLANGPAFAGVVPEGVVCAAGMVEQNPGNFRCWGITDDKLASKHFLAVNRAMLAFFAESRRRRIETIVQVGNRRGVRWVTQILGFKEVGVMHAFNEYGDAILYERI